MKTIKTTNTLIALILISTFAYASGNVRLNMNPAEKESAFVEIIKNSETEVEVEVKNGFNEVVFYKKLSAPIADYKRKYDFSDLEYGMYRLLVSSGIETNETWFKIERGVVSVENSRKTLAPHMKSEGNMWKISCLNFQMEDTGLYVYDGSSLLYQKKIAPVFAVNEGLDLSQLLPGKYQIVFANEHNYYEYEIEIN